MQKIVTYLWFDKEALEAAKFYTSIFKNSKITSENPMITTFELEGQEYIALNGGPQYKFTEAISLLVNCDTQEEVDEYWDKFLSNGGVEGQCGWLKDKYGLSWQIIPKQLGEYMSDSNQAKAQATIQAMLKMKKLVIAELKKAHDEA